MSCDSRYIVQYEGPFGTDEIQGYKDSYAKEMAVFDFKDLTYGMFFFETKHCPDEKVIKIAKATGAISVVTNDENRVRFRILSEYPHSSQP
jgi:hypothetical protein